MSNRERESSRNRILDFESRFTEYIGDPILFSAIGYKDVVERLNDLYFDHRSHPVELVDYETIHPVELVDNETIADELEDWLTPDKISYMAAMEAKNPEQTFSLVMTPNVTVSGNDLHEIGNRFATFPPKKDYRWFDMLTTYSDDVVSGTDPGNLHPIQFSLVPTVFDQDITGDIEFQIQKLAELQTEYPFLRASSPFEDLTRIITLLASGYNPNNQKTIQTTLNRSFMMEGRSMGDYDPGPYVPMSYLTPSGKMSTSWICFTKSLANGEGVGRFVIGD